MANPRDDGVVHMVERSLWTRFHAHPSYYIFTILFNVQRSDYFVFWGLFGRLYLLQGNFPTCCQNFLDMLAMELWSINPLYMCIYELYFVKLMVNTKILIPSTLIKINAAKYMMMV